MTQAAPAATPRTKEYETIYVLRPDVDKDASEKLAARIQGVVGSEGGTLTLIESWGRRRLAYPVAKHRRGVYVYLKYLGSGKTVHEVERQLNLQDSVLKFQTVKVRDDVETGSVVVNPDDLKFEAPEAQDETDADDSIERQLGLDDSAPHDRRDRMRDDDDMGDDGDETPGEGPSEGEDERS